MNFLWVDILLIIVGVFLITLVVLQGTKDDVARAFSGEKSELFANKKERGFELLLSRVTYGTAFVFLALAFTATFVVERGLLG
ncbi:preprotein translocase subunit SecG [Mycoplasmatota bacterium]|nr:preprotein translocase subunit SecG [Mycoplasmatota bacterium]